MDETLAEGDFSRTGDSLDEGLDLQTLVIASLFSDAPPRDGDPVDPGSPRTGYWADAYSPDADVYGSRLWILKRSKLSKQTPILAKLYAEEALAWMVADGLASRVEFDAEIRKINSATKGCFLFGDVYRPNERTPIAFEPWELVRGAA